MTKAVRAPPSTVISNAKLQEHAAIFDPENTGLTTIEGTTKGLIKMGVSDGWAKFSRHDYCRQFGAIDWWRQINRRHQKHQQSQA